MQRIVASFLLLFFLSGQSALAVGGVAIKTRQGVQPIDAVQLLLVTQDNMVDGFRQKVQIQKRRGSAESTPTVAASAAAASAAEAEQPVPSTLDTALRVHGS